jgi:hypothetical protein
MSGGLNPAADWIKSTHMSFRKDALLPTICTIVWLLWLPGCAEETPELTGPMTRAPHPNTTVSGYMRSEVMFGR